MKNSTFILVSAIPVLIMILLSSGAFTKAFAPEQLCTVTAYIAFVIWCWAFVRKKERDT